MSIPRRIWRVIRGRWRLADDGVREALAEELAAYELAQSTRPPSEPGTALPRAAHPTGQYKSRYPTAAGRADPLAADLALLGAPPACDMATLDRIYQERLTELEQEASSSDTQAADARRTQLSEAYERLRDAINTTETRFEKLEF
jgi:hypothetical protein